LRIQIRTLLYLLYLVVNVLTSSGPAHYTAASATGDCCGGVWGVKNNVVHLVGFHIFGDITRNGFVPITPELLKVLSGSGVFQPSL